MPTTAISSTYKPETKRQKYELIRAQLENERSSFLPHWRMLGDYILPRRPRINSGDQNRGDRRNQNIIDSTATLAARTLRSGMVGGITSPARPWFRLTTPDAEMAEFGPVKDWLHEVTQIMQTTYLRSNLYQVLPTLYGDMGVFGTAAMFIEEDFERVIQNTSLPIGSYSISTNKKGQVDGITRVFSYTVRQIVEKFGKRDANGNIDWSNFSSHVKNLWDNCNYEVWVEVVHIIMPNVNWNERMMASKNKRYLSAYYESGNSSKSTGNYINGYDDEVLLSEKGFDSFPVLVPRWETTGEDSWATSCPGMEALGDIKQLQLGEKRLMQAIEKKVNPPMVGPSIMRNVPSSLLPGGTTWVDEREGMKGFRTAHEVTLDINQMEEKQNQCRQRTSKAFYEDLFLMLSYTDRREITAREVEERHEEKLLALGPVLEQLNQDLLDPLTDITFKILVRQGAIPPAPEELQGSDLKVEYISVMAQAQKLVGISGAERFISGVTRIAADTQNPDILDKVDLDQFIDEYADALGISPRIIRSDEDVAAIREEKAKAARARQAAEQARQITGGVKDLAGAKMDEDNALTRIVKETQQQPAA